MTALTTIREEHQAIASMLQGLTGLVRGIRDYRAQPNFELMHAMLYYIDTFPERLHHPKEERWLFQLLAKRHPPARPLLDLLTEQHREGGERLRAIDGALAAYKQAGATAFAAFADAVDGFVAFQRDHIAQEEREVFPLAQEHLTRDDWRHIDAAFAAHADPLRGVTTHQGFGELHRRLFRLRPSPEGGPAQS